MKKITKAIIPAAGYGTRFLPATKSLPKEMLSIIDKPTLQFVIEEAVDSGIEDILIILSRNKESIINHFDKNIELEDHLRKQGKLDEIEKLQKLEKLAKIYYMRQDAPRGLGHAISLGKTFAADDPVAILLGDDIVIGDNSVTKQLIETYEEYQSTILGVQRVEDEFLHKYGIIDGSKIEDSIYDVKNMIEKPSNDQAPSNFAILGRYIITPKIFEILKNQKPGKNNEIQLTDALVELTNYEKIYAKEFEGQRYDLGSKLGMIKATIDKAVGTEEFREDTLNYMRMVLEKNK